MKHPEWSILNPAKKYTGSAQTDIRKLFARVRREMAEKKPSPQVLKMRRA